MTGAILQSDVDFATRMLRSGRSEEEILFALSRRGIDILRAMRLIEDLQSGRPVVPEMLEGFDEPIAPGSAQMPPGPLDLPPPPPPTPALATVSPNLTAAGPVQALGPEAGQAAAPARPEPQLRPLPDPAPQPQSAAPVQPSNPVASPYPRRPARPFKPALRPKTARPPSATRFLWLAAGLALTSLTILIGVALMTKARASSGAAGPERSERPKVAFVVASDAIYFAGQPLTPSNTLEVLTSALGRPQRKLSGPHWAHTFEAYGCRVYCDGQQRAEFILLDFLGTDAGLFRGELKFGDTAIGPGTASEELPAIDGMIFYMFNENDGTFVGNYHKLSVDFLYNNSRISMVHIGLQESGPDRFLPGRHSGGK